jgi:hypothetical protein
VNRLATTAVAILLAASAALAQGNGGFGMSPWFTPYTRTQQGQPGQAGRRDLVARQGGLVNQQNAPVQGLRTPGARNPFQVQWNQPQSLQLSSGFPVFPSQLSALFGALPAPSSPAQIGPDGLVLPSAPAPDEPPGWPAWVRTREKEPLPFAADVGLLIRHAERVWWRPDVAEPFVPLAFHDKLRTLGSGAEVEVRTIGEFELLLHNTTRISARGPTQLLLRKLAPEAVAIAASKLTWLRLSATDRVHDIDLPGGHRLRITPPPPATVPFFLPAPVPLAMALPGVTDLVFTRADEPGWLGGRASISNVGTTEVTFVHATGEVRLPPGHRLGFLLATGAEAVPAQLTSVDAPKQPEGDAVAFRANGAGKVAWQGAEFDLPPGARLRLDPQQGAPFAAAPAAPPATPPTAPAPMPVVRPGGS